LVPVGTAVGGFFAKEGMLRAGAGSASMLVPVWDHTKNEMIFGRVDPGGELHYDIKFTFYIAFGNVPTFQGHEVLAVLHHLASVVERILMATEAECRRIGLLK
jgi:hypothetical protein